MLRAMLLVATFAGACLPAAAAPEEPPGIDLNHPKLIDAAAAILFSSARPEDFHRIGDDRVAVNITGQFDRELRTMPSKKCAVQLIDTSRGQNVYGQFDFSRLYRDYLTYPGSFPGGTRIRLLGDSMYCDKGRGGVDCRGAYDVETGGVAGTRIVLKAISFIGQHLCPPMD